MNIGFALAHFQFWHWCNKFPHSSSEQAQLKKHLFFKIITRYKVQDDIHQFWIMLFIYKYRVLISPRVHELVASIPCKQNLHLGCVFASWYSQEMLQPSHSHLSFTRLLLAAPKRKSASRLRCSIPRFTLCILVTFLIPNAIVKASTDDEAIGRSSASPSIHEIATSEESKSNTYYWIDCRQIYLERKQNVSYIS